MSDKFLNTSGSGNSDLSNGSTTIFAATLSADNLDPSMPIKTNSVKQLISTNLEIADVNNLQSELDNVLTNPFAGTLQADDFKGDSIKDKTETSTINLTATEIDLVATSVKVNGQAVDASVDLQDAYNNSVVAETQLTTTKPYTIKAVDTAILLNIDGDTKEVNINGDLLVNGSNLETQISNVEGDITNLETKTQNIDLLNTDSTKTTFNQNLLVDEIETKQIYAKDNTGLKLNGDFKTGANNDTYIRMDGTDIDIEANSDITIKTTDLIILDGRVSCESDITTEKTIFTQDKELVSKLYVDTSISNIPSVDLTDLNTKTQNIDLLNTDATKTTFNQNLIANDIITTNIKHPTLTSDITMNPGFVNINTTNTFLNSTVELGNLMFPSIASGVDIGVETIGQFRNIFCDRVGGLTTPVNASDAATKAYVDEQNPFDTAIANIEPLNELVSTYGSPSVCLGVRKLVSTYTGNCFEVIDALSATALIGFDANGIADYTAFIALTAPVYINIWYDQSGNGYNFTGELATVAKPSLIFTTVNGRNNPSVVFNGSKFSYINQLDLGLQNASHTSIFSTKSNSSDIQFLSGSGINSQKNEIFLNNVGNGLTVFDDTYAPPNTVANIGATNDYTDNSWHTIVGGTNGNFATCRADLLTDSVAIDVTTQNTDILVHYLGIRNYSSVYPFDGEMSEFVVFPNNWIANDDVYENYHTNLTEFHTLGHNNAISAEFKPIKNIIDPQDPQDAATKAYVDSKTTPLETKTQYQSASGNVTTFVSQIHSGTVRPLVDNLYDCGIPSSRWRKVWTTDIDTGNVSTSNITANTLTENIAVNKISNVGGNVAEIIAANKVVNAAASILTTSNLHQFAGKMTSDRTLAQITDPADITTKAYVDGTDASTKDYVDRLDTSQKRYDIENPVSVNVEVNKPVSWLGIENASFTFEIQKDEIGYTAPINGVAPISVDVPQSFYNRKWNIIPFTANLSEENTKIGFNQNPGFERFYGFPIFDFNSTASFKFKTTGMATAGDLYIGFIDDLTNLNGIVGFTGQSVGGSLYTDGVASGGSSSKWTTGDECFLSVSGGQWFINRVGDPPVGSLPFVDNGKPYYFAIINNEGGGNFVEMEITEVITDYVAPTTKQIGVNGSIEFNSNPVYVDTSDNLVYADSATNIAYPIAGKNYELITKFDPSLTQATLYSDANFTFYWDGINKQPQFSKTFTGFVDTTIILIKGSTPLPFANTLSFATDINPAASSITYFYGGAIADIAFNHVNWSSRTTLTILDENDNTRPSYILEYFTGNVNGAGTFTMKKIL